MRSCWKSDPHIETQSVNNCTYGLPWKGLQPGFMCRYHSGFDRVKWNQHPVYLEADPGTFIKNISLFFFFIFLCYSIWNESRCPLSAHKRISRAVNEELGKLDYSKKDKERRKRKWQVLCDGVGWGSQQCSEACFGPHREEHHPKQLSVMAMCQESYPFATWVDFLDWWNPHRHLGYFEVWGNKITLFQKFDFKSKVFPPELQLLWDKMPPSPKKIPRENS